jgi:hypothetical protein
MRNRHRYGNLLGYVDICMNLLMCFISLFAFTLLLIKLESAANTHSAMVDTTSKLIIHISWDPTSYNDVDLWVKTDNPESIVGFKHKDAANMFLDNDNLGFSSHAVVKNNGTTSSSFGNNEHVHIKECTDTIVTINVHLYSQHLSATDKVHIELLRTQPFSVLYSTDVDLTTAGQESTAFAFNMREDCSVSNINNAQDMFVYNHLDYSKPPGAQMRPQGLN